MAAATLAAPAAATKTADDAQRRRPTTGTPPRAALRLRRYDARHKGSFTEHPEHAKYQFLLDLPGSTTGSSRREINRRARTPLLLKIDSTQVTRAI